MTYLIPDPTHGNYGAYKVAGKMVPVIAQQKRLNVCTLDRLGTAVKKTSRGVEHDARAGLTVNHHRHYRYALRAFG